MSVVDFEIRTAQLTPGTYVVSVSGEIDMYTAPELEQQLERVLADGASSAIVDLVEVGFIDSTALGVLLKALPRFARRGGELILVSDDRRVLKTLAVTGLDGKFVVEAKLAEAIVRFLDRSPQAKDARG